MTRLSVAVSPRAEEEAQEAARWYEERSAGLGVAFLDIIEQTLIAIADNPARFPVVHGDLRRASLKRFPFGVFFRIRPDRIKILSILHLSRDPNRWRSLR